MSTNQYGFPITIPGSKAPVRMWSPLYDVDHTAQQQIRNASLLPWVHGVAVMPDVHAGAGVTVGSVIAMHGAVSPAAVRGYWLRNDGGKNNRHTFRSAR